MFQLANQEVAILRSQFATLKLDEASTANTSPTTSPNTAPLWSPWCSTPRVLGLRGSYSTFSYISLSNPKLPSSTEPFLLTRIGALTLSFLSPISSTTYLPGETKGMGIPFQSKTLTTRIV